MSLIRFLLPLLLLAVLLQLPVVAQVGFDYSATAVWIEESGPTPKISNVSISGTATQGAGFNGTLTVGGVSVQIECPRIGGNASYDLLTGTSGTHTLIMTLCWSNGVPSIYVGPSGPQFFGASQPEDTYPRWQW